MDLEGALLLRIRLWLEGPYLHRFLLPVAPDAAGRAIQQLVAAPDRLIAFPRLGTRVDGYAPRDVRRLAVGTYELRYEIAGDQIYVLRIWHVRELRR